MKSSKSDLGQSAVEYLVVFSAVLALFTSITFTQMINPSSEAARDSLLLSQARASADSIAGAINTVYANGRGAVKSVAVQIDGNWTIELDNEKNVLRIIVGISTGNESLEDNLKYRIFSYHTLQNVSAGLYNVVVEWPDNLTILEDIYGGALANKKIFVYIRPQGG